MLFPLSPRAEDLRSRMIEFMEAHVYPAETVFEEELNAMPNRWGIPAVMEELKDRAKAQGLWNLFLPKREYPDALSNLDYATICEVMGRVADRSGAVQLLRTRYREHGDDRAIRDRGAQGALARAPARRRDPLLLRHDGAGRRLVGRHQHPDRDPARRRRLCDQRTQMVDVRAPWTRAARSRS